MPEPMGGSRDLVWQGVLVRQGQSYNVTWLSEHDVITKVCMCLRVCARRVSHAKPMT